LAIIPALNEAPRIGAVIQGLRATCDIDVLVVDDGSTDETALVARDHGAAVARHPFRLGYGAALQTGYMRAVRDGYRACVQLDADGQHDPAFAQALLDELQRSGADVVIGSRFATRAQGTKRGLRLAGSLASRGLGYLLARIDTTDPTSGFRALGQRALALLSEEGFPDDYPDIDVLIELRCAGLTITEIPVADRPRLSGVSMHRGWRPLYYTYKVSLAAAIEAVRGTRRAPDRRIK
jgi:glycosyltransferase involved in cell wall biosynthesis